VTNELLQPSLRSNSDVRHGLSIQSQFLVGFLGGPFMALPFLAFHSHYQAKLKRDWIVLVAIAVLLAAGIYGIKLAGIEADHGWTKRIITRGSGVFMVGIYYLFNRENQKNIESFERYKSPWIPALISALIGLPLPFLISQFKAGL
jgi:VIT1/CCC1 family predicted Fe2+/Mn2+ transporter